MKGILDISTRVGCKVACDYCPHETFAKAAKKQKNPNLLALDTFTRCIDKVPSTVDIKFGGMVEPWLNPECTKMVLYAHTRGHKIHATTTLVGFKLEDVDFLEPIPFTFFGVHLPSIEKYENIPVDSSYLETLDKLQCSHINATFHFHGKDVPPVIRSLLKERPEQWPLSTRARNLESSYIPTPMKLRGVLGCNLYPEHELRHNNLLPNGDVHLCCMDFGIKHTLGNLLTTNYEDLFRSEEFKKIQNGLRSSTSDILCRHCDLFAYYKSKSLIFDTYDRIAKHTRAVADLAVRMFTFKPNKKAPL